MKSELFFMLAVFVALISGIMCGAIIREQAICGAVKHALVLTKNADAQQALAAVDLCQEK